MLVCQTLRSRFGALEQVARGQRSIPAGQLETCNKAAGPMAEIDGGDGPVAKSEHDAIPTEDVSAPFEPIEQDYKEQPRARESGRVPSSYPVSDPDAPIDPPAQPGAAARLPHQDPPPSFETAPAAARPAERLPPRPVSPPAGRPVDVVDPGVAERIGACADPAALSLSARLVARFGDHLRSRARIEVVGIVRNIGRAAYISDPRQQSVELIEEHPGSPSRVVRRQTFTNLSAGGQLRLVHPRFWDTAVEFPPRFRMQITYEPDIRTDANPRNDDCGPANNEAVLEPDRINALFH